MYQLYMKYKQCTYLSQIINDEGEKKEKNGRKKREEQKKKKVSKG